MVCLDDLERSTFSQTKIVGRQEIWKIEAVGAASADYLLTYNKNCPDSWIRYR